MTSLNKTINRRVGSLFAVAALVLATVTPGLIPAFASAAQLTERSVELSSSSKTATNVQYNVTFNTISDADAVVLDFCQNSPLVGSACTDPVGFSAAAATTPTSGFTVSQTTAGSDDAVVLIGDVTGDEFTVTLAGVTNPSTAGPLYVRIVTFDTSTNALAYTSANPGTGVVDEGSAAVSITDSIGVSAAVNETLTFCVAKNEITAPNCTREDEAALEAPTLRLGEGTGDALALQSTSLSTGSIYSQLSTNAANGAVVNLKSGNTCGGLMRTGATVCDIAPALDSNVAANQAKIGIQVKPGSDPAGVGVANGTLQSAAYYDDTIFKLAFIQGGASGVTSVFGDSVLDTAGGPVSNKNAQITFGASITNTTPAGLYSNDYSLIATGKY